MKVGTSVDPIGPDRILQDGRPQYPLWIEKFLMSCEGGLPPGIVFTMTVDHIGHAEEVYRFFKNLRSLARHPIDIRINPMYPAGAAAHLEASKMLKPAAYGEFLLRLRELWERDGMPFRLSPLGEWHEGTDGSCDFLERCGGRFIGLDGDGGVYHCGRFMDAGERLGNLLDRGLGEILQDARRGVLDRRADLLRAGPCRDCPHWSRCHGGCPYQARLAYGDAMRPSPFCEAYRMLLDRTPGSPA